MTSIKDDNTAMEASQAPWKTANQPQVTVLQEGLVHIKQFLSLPQQNELAKSIYPSEGFWEAGPDGTPVLNSTKTRGRIFQAMDKLPPVLCNLLTDYGKQAHLLACAADPGMPLYKPTTHALLLYYATNRGIGEHRDDSPNDGSADQPVISLNLGKSIDFSVRHDKNQARQIIRMESGDVILFGGRTCRQILHSVTKIYPNTSPLTMLTDVQEQEKEEVRLNVTLRYAPEILGREDAYKSFKPVRGSATSKEKANAKPPPTQPNETPATHKKARRDGTMSGRG